MIDQVAEIIRVSPPSQYKKGCHASFTKINDQWGLKFFYEDNGYGKKMRDKTYDMQKKAEAIGCAPMLGEKFEMTTPNGEMVYGYITECVEKLLSETIAYNDDYWLMPEHNELKTKLETIILEVSDLHDDNVGYMSDGRLVCIDFSFCE